MAKQRTIVQTKLQGLFDVRLSDGRVVRDATADQVRAVALTDPEVAVVLGRLVRKEGFGG